jgi:hypothetical protein
MYARTTAIAGIAAAGLLLTACGGSKPVADVSGRHVSASARAASSPGGGKALTAAQAFQEIATAVPTAKLSGAVTAANDPNHLLGRPNQYTSKVTFTDSRVSKSDADGYQPGDVELGGAIEVFPDAADAQARARYIETVTRAMPALTEYDYVHDTVVVRVSRYLTPAQAADYKTAEATSG